MPNTAIEPQHNNTCPPQWVLEFYSTMSFISYDFKYDKVGKFVWAISCEEIHFKEQSERLFFMHFLKKRYGQVKNLPTPLMLFMLYLHIAAAG